MATVFMRFPGGKAKALTFSYDDGVIFDKRLVDIFRQHGLYGTFNVNSGLFGQGNRLTEEEVAALYLPAGQELAIHALTHPFLEKISPECALYEVAEDRRRLEALTGAVIRGMAYPYGTYSDRVVDILKTAGIAYSRTTAATQDFRLPTDWLRLSSTCHHKSERLPELTDRFLTHSPDEKETRRDPWLFYVWGHSYEFNENDNWDLIENFADRVSGREDVWYATNIQIYDYVTAYNALQYSLNGDTVKNPSAMDVWLCRYGKTICVPAGQTVSLR